MAGAANAVCGDVQGADAGPVRESIGQAFVHYGEGDAGRVAVLEGYHVQLLGAFDFFPFLSPPFFWFFFSFFLFVSDVQRYSYRWFVTH